MDGRIAPRPLLVGGSGKLLNPCLYSILLITRERSGKLFMSVFTVRAGLSIGYETIHGLRLNRRPDFGVIAVKGLTWRRTTLFKRNVCRA